MYNLYLFPRINATQVEVIREMLSANWSCEQTLTSEQHQIVQLVIMLNKDLICKASIKLESSLLTMLLGDACEASGRVGLGTAERELKPVEYVQLHGV